MVAKRNFVFSTDCCKKDSVKGQERIRCGVSQRYIIGGPATRKPTDFKMFLANDENKRQLCKLLLQVWSSSAAASRLEKSKTALIVVEGNTYQLDSANDEVSDTLICISWLENFNFNVNEFL